MQWSRIIISTTRQGLPPSSDESNSLILKESLQALIGEVALFDPHTFQQPTLAF